MNVTVWNEPLSLCRLRDAKGGDDARFSLLMGPMGGKLVSRGSPSDNLALMQAVLAARGINIVEERGPAAPSSLHAPPGQQQYHQPQVCVHALLPYLPMSCMAPLTVTCRAHDHQMIPLCCSDEKLGLQHIS